MMQLFIFKDGNSPSLFDKTRENVTELKTKAGTMQSDGDELPGHMKLPALQEILKMRPPPDDDGNGIAAFTFVAEHLVGAVLGQKVWDEHKCRDQISTRLTPSDEAYIYLVLSNSYDLWRNAGGTRVGTGKFTTNGTNKKNGGWTREGIHLYNGFMHEVKENRQAAWARDVEEEVREALKLRYDGATQRHTQAVRRRRRKKRRMHNDYSSDEDELDVDIDAENDLGIAFASV
jgi:hypothetical protein